MSDLSIYELDDIIWDEFGQSNDHIVPHSSDESANEQASTVDSQKKPRLEVRGVSSNADNKYAAKCVSQEKEERDLSTVNIRNNTMLKQGPWSHSPDNMFFGLCESDSIKEATNLESNDFLYYSWPDIGNFEDVDRMFRSCDSLFGLGNSGNEDETGWLSVSKAIEGSEDALGSDFKFPSPDSNALRNQSEELEPSKLKNEGSSVNSVNMKSESVSHKATSQLSEIDKPASPSCMSFVNGSNQISESKNDFILGDQIDSQKKQQKQKEGKQKGEHVDNGGSLRHIKDLQKAGSGDNSHKGYTSIGGQQQRQRFGLGSFDYPLANIAYIPPGYHQSSDQTTVDPTLYGIKSGNSTPTSLSQNESSHASNVVKPMERSHDFPFEVTDITPAEETKQKLGLQQGFQPSFDSYSKHVDLGSICNPVSLQTGNQFQSQSDIEGISMGIPAESGPLNVKERSSINSGFNEVTPEARSFHQLEQVMEQLDLRTKLCIRDSLYRLARSAEQRHNNADLKGGPGDDRDSGTILSEGTNKCTGFMDIETDTNPIDRSVAHLLFHRPSLTHKSHANIPESVAVPPMMVEKLLCHEESVSETNGNVVGH